MNANEIVAQIKKEFPKLEVEYLPRRNRITAYGFHIEVTAKSKLIKMGFECGPNSGTLNVAAEAETAVELELSFEDIKESFEYWSR